MSYDVELVDPESKEVIQLPEKHQLRGGTYCCGGVNELHLNVTYNYCKILHSVIDGGIRGLYGKTAEETIPILAAAIGKLGDDVDVDYWKATEGNVKKALQDLLTLACLAPKNAVWQGD